MLNGGFSPSTSLLRLPGRLTRDGVRGMDGPLKSSRTPGSTKSRRRNILGTDSTGDGITEGGRSFSSLENLGLLGDGILTRRGVG